MLLGASYGAVAEKLGWDYSVLMSVVSLSSLSLFIHLKQPYAYRRKTKSKSILKEAKKLLKNTNIKIVYLSSVLFWSHFFIIDCFVWLYFEKEFNADMSFIGYCLLAQKLPELLVSYNTEIFINKLGYKGMQLLAFIVLSLRFLALSFLTKDNYKWGAILTESVHSLSLIMMSCASILMINTYTPKSLISTS